MTKQLIPKKIHYCWFGKKKLPKKYLSYIEQWKKFFPDYEIIKWDETNFPITEFNYAQEALQEGKMAFVSDVARVYALYTMGGIYFDTDVEVVRSFDDILINKKAVLGTEVIGETIGTGFMAFVPEHEICAKMLNYYRINHFYEQPVTQSNTQILAKIIKENYNIFPDDKIQHVDLFSIYPPEYFTAFNGITRKDSRTNNTYCVHHFAASWFSPLRKIKNTIKGFIRNILR